tara:strand:- start:124 stop:495 length:372 start_codon:yes stop_codon:yes gene_type:complete
MALTLSPVVVNAGTIYAVQTDATCTVDTLTGTSGKLFKVEIDNTANSVPVYVKLYDTTGGVTHATTDPNWVLKCPASVSRVFTCATGNAFANGIKALCATEPGTGSTATVNPANDVTYRILLG